MTDKEFVNLQRVGLTLGRPLTLPFLQCQLLNLIHSQRTDKTVRFCFCTSLLDEMKKKLYNINQCFMNFVFKHHVQKQCNIFVRKIEFCKK